MQKIPTQFFQPLAQPLQNMRVLFMLYFVAGVGTRAWLSHQLNIEWTLSVPGLVGDALMAFFLAALTWAVAYLHKAAAVVLIVAWALLSMANLEHIFALDAPLRIENYRFAVEGTFLKGSLLNVRNGGAMLFVVLLGGLLIRKMMRTSPSLISAVTALVLVIASGLATWKHALLTTDWRNSSPIILIITQSGGSVGSDESGLAHLDSLGDTDLFFNNEVALGKREAATQPEKTPNVLLVILEGLPGVYLQQVRAATGINTAIDMPNFSNIAKQGRVLAQLVTNGYGTISGLYNILCGDYALNIGEVTIKPFVLETLPAAEQPRCLPRQLASAGYQTVFMQAAELNFMSKNKIMPIMGFAETYGKESGGGANESGNFWGATDSVLLRRALDKIQTLRHNEKPWLLTLLSVGTHHPFLAPESYLDKYKTAKEAAVRYLDDSLVGFVDELKAMGAYEDTLIVFLSDESHGVPGHPFGKHWGLAVAMGANVQPSVVTDIFSQTDLPASVLDYLNQPPTQDALIGRSFFRSYDRQPRHLLFGDFMLNGNAVVKCQFDSCRQYAIRQQQLFAPTYQIANVDVAQKRIYHSALARAQNFYGKGSRLPLLLAQNLQWQEGGLNSLSQRLTLPADSMIEVVVDMENIHPDNFTLPLMNWIPIGEASYDAFSGLRLPPLVPRGHLKVNYSFFNPTEQTGDFLLKIYPRQNEAARIKINAFHILTTPAHVAADDADYKVSKFVLEYPLEAQQIYNEFFSKAVPSENPLVLPYARASFVSDNKAWIAPTYKIGTRLDWANSNDWQPPFYLARDWSFTDSWGVWSDGMQPTLGFFLKDDLTTAQKYEVLIEFYPHLNPPLVAERTMGFVLNGQTLGQLTFTEGGLRKRGITVPASVLKSNALNTFSFEIKDPFSASKYAQGNDFTRVGVGLASFEIRPAP